MKQFTVYLSSSDSLGRKKLLETNDWFGAKRLWNSCDIDKNETILIEENTDPYYTTIVLFRDGKKQQEENK